MIRFLFIFFLLVLAGCLTVETTSKSRVFVEKPEVKAVQKQLPATDIPALDYLEFTDNSKLVLHTLQINVTVRNTGEREIVLTRLCTDVYDYFNKVMRKDVWFMVAPLAPNKEKHIKKDFYTEPTQSQIPKNYSIRICGAVYSEGIGS